MLLGLQSNVVKVMGRKHFLTTIVHDASSFVCYVVLAGQATLFHVV